MSKHPGGRPPSGRGKRLYIKHSKVRAVELIGELPDEALPIVETLLEALTLKFPLEGLR